MKLRIKGNSLRLRITRSEFAQLQQLHRIEERIQFSTKPEDSMLYALAPDNNTDLVDVKYHQGEILVLLAPEQLKNWEQEKQIGIYTSIDVGSGQSLEIALEKDFACLSSKEDQSDAFANPEVEQTC